MFLPNELLIYSGPVITKRGLFHKKRTLIVTDYPRLLCVKEDKSTVRVKHEILFRPLPGDPPAAPHSTHHRLGTGRKEDNFPIFRSVTTENPKTFWVHTVSSAPPQRVAADADARDAVVNQAVAIRGPERRRRAMDRGDQHRRKSRPNTWRRATGVVAAAVSLQWTINRYPSPVAVRIR